MVPGIDYDIFRNNLKKARYIQDLTAKDLSEMAGLRQQKMIADIEEGKGKPSLDEVFAICQVLNQPIDAMLKNEGKITIEYK